MQKYYVMLIIKDDEFELLKTTSEEEAVQRAQDEQYYIQRDKRKGEKIEIRAYHKDIEDEDCTCFDYDLIDFEGGI